MAEYKNFIEMGDFLIEFNDHYLGAGDCSWRFAPQGRDIRRDAWSKPLARQLNAVKWCIVVELSGGDRFWQMVAPGDELSQTQLTGRLFSHGAELKLYPADLQRAGFRFERVYLESLEQQSGTEGRSGRLKLNFSSEAAIGNSKYFTRIQPGSLPSGAVLREDIKLETLQVMLLEKLAALLACVPGQGINLNAFAAAENGSFALFLTGCREWRKHTPRCLEYTLSGAFPYDRKSWLDNQLLLAADMLSDCRLELDGSGVLAGQVKALDSGIIKNVNGRKFCESSLRFSLFTD